MAYTKIGNQPEHIKAFHISINEMHWELVQEQKRLDQKLKGKRALMDAMVYAATVEEALVAAE